MPVCISFVLWLPSGNVQQHEFRRSSLIKHSLPERRKRRQREATVCSVRYCCGCSDVLSSPKRSLRSHDMLPLFWGGKKQTTTKKGREKTHNLKEIEPPNKPKRYPAQINVFCTLPSIHNGTYTRYSLYSSTDQTNTIKSDQLLVVPNKQK